MLWPAGSDGCEFYIYGDSGTGLEKHFRSFVSVVIFITGADGKGTANDRMIVRFVFAPAVCKVRLISAEAQTSWNYGGGSKIKVPNTHL